MYGIASIEGKDMDITTQWVDMEHPYLHIVVSGGSVQKQLHPNGEIVDSHDNREELEQWSIDYINDNPNVEQSYVVDNPYFGGK